jgi:hypothetical protein
MKIIGILFILFCFIDSVAFELPSNYSSNSEKDFTVIKQQDGTYNFYLKDFPKILLYKSRLYDLNIFSETICGKGSINVTGGVFAYEVNDTIKFSATDAVFLNKKNQEISAVYSGFGSGFVCSPNHEIMADADKPNEPKVIFLHPIFRSQIKVWIIIPRDYGNVFPGLSEAFSEFKKNGDLYLVVSSDLDPKDFHLLVATKTETIPIDYSLFEKPVSKPTCYAMPENHKLRPCTKEETKLRSPALKVFLGET